MAISVADRPMRVLEFYSGIGGLRYSLQESGVEALVLEAFDINEVANDVYEHNFGHRPSQRNIQRLTAHQLDAYQADTWIMSPPCQPYTRQGFSLKLDWMRDVKEHRVENFPHGHEVVCQWLYQSCGRPPYDPRERRGDSSFGFCHYVRVPEHFSSGLVKVAGLRKDAGDARAYSFLQMLEMLPQMKFPPNYILVENVVGFENSITHGHLIDKFKDLGFTTQEFIMSPQQLGIPYSRPRYFCLAKKEPKSFVQPTYNNKLLCQLGPLADYVKLQSEDKTNIPDARAIANASSTAIESSYGADGPLRRQPLMKMNEPVVDPGVHCRPIHDFMEEEPCTSHDIGTPPLLKKLISDDQEFVEGETVIIRSPDGEKACDMASCTDKWELYKLPSTVLERWGDCFDVVTEDSRMCCCFTKSYGSYAKGTGSLIATKNVWHDGMKFRRALITQDLPNGVSLHDLGLRYFTPREIANLHSFPPAFTFPSQVSLRQRYALLGNSLSVAVVAVLLRYLFSEPNQQAIV